MFPPCDLRFLMIYSIGHLFNNFHGPNANGTHSLKQVDDVFFIISKFVGVEFLADGWIFGFLFFVLVENPFKRRSLLSLNSMLEFE